jgi:hypothetical protein
MNNRLGLRIPTQIAGEEDERIARRVVGDQLGCNVKAPAIGEHLVQIEQLTEFAHR